MKKLYVLGGGTISHVRNHLALCAPAYGTTARTIFDMCTERYTHTLNYIRLTRMADFTSKMETNEDVGNLITELKTDPDTGIIFFNVALCDWTGEMAVNMSAKEQRIPSGKYADRLKTSEGMKLMSLSAAPKVIRSIRDGREDIFVVGFKTTCGASFEEQEKQGRNLLEASNINVVLANDTRTRANMIISHTNTYTPTKNRKAALAELVDIVQVVTE